MTRFIYFWGAINWGALLLNIEFSQARIIEIVMVAVFLALAFKE